MPFGGSWQVLWGPETGVRQARGRVAPAMVAQGEALYLGKLHSGITVDGTLCFGGKGLVYTLPLDLFLLRGESTAQGGRVLRQICGCVGLVAPGPLPGRSNLAA